MRWHEFKLPELGENVEKGDVVRVLVNVGDVVKKDQPVVELETDKATIEVPSPVGGTVTEVKVKPGDKVKVGPGRARADEVGRRIRRQRAPRPERKPREAQQGRSSRRRSPQPSSREHPRPRPRPARSPAAKHGGVVDIVPTGRAAVATRQRWRQRARPSGAPPRSDARRAGAAAPSVRRYARELGVDIGEVPGTGPGRPHRQDDVTRVCEAAS